MSNTFSLAHAGEHDGPLPQNPFRSLRAHYGMLLGVEDFETLDAYHRGKMWLHNAWLHGAGCVWGLDVRLDVDHNEIQVLPGLAWDGMGRELYLDTAACVNIGQWFVEHQSEVATTEIESGVEFAAHVSLAWKSCAARPVPALTEPCAGSDNATAYSRVLETVELRLVPGAAPPLESFGHRQQLLLGLAEPQRVDPEDPSSEIVESDRLIIEESHRLASLPPHQRPLELQRALHHLAVQDSLERLPATLDDTGERTLMPAHPPASVTLAELSIALSEVDGQWQFSASQTSTVDTAVRPIHLATSTLVALLAGQSGVDSPAVTGPQIDADGVTVDSTTLTIALPTTSEIHAASISLDSFSVSVFSDATGWEEIVIDSVTFDSTTMQIELVLDVAPAGELTRIIARGTGPTPLLGIDLLPLAGKLGQTAASDSGQDFVITIRN